MIREHRHLIVRAHVKNPPQDAEVLSEWCKRVISDVGMQVIGGPLVVRGEMKDNEGWTAVAILDFSHLSVHTWDRVSPALIEFDLFSCKDFDLNKVLDKINEFDMIYYSYIFVDRDSLDYPADFPHIESNFGMRITKNDTGSAAESAPE